MLVLTWVEIEVLNGLLSKERPYEYKEERFIKESIIDKCQLMSEVLIDKLKTFLFEIV